MNDIELLKTLYKDMDMAKSSLEDVYNVIKDNDNKIKEHILTLIKCSNKNIDKLNSFLERSGEEKESEGLFAELSAKIGIKKDIGKDNSDVNIADMLIKGMTMGKLNIEKHLKSDVEIDPELEKLAKEMLEYYDKSIEETEKYL